jgi:ribonuclease HI
MNKQMNEQGNLFDNAEQVEGWWTLHTDGASRGNPGPAGAGAVLRDPEGIVLGELSRFLGTATNNEAEYQALIMGLEEARAMGANRLRILLDSELVVKQVQGLYRVKNTRLRKLYDRAMGLLQEMNAYDILHIGRELNSEADSLASQAARKAREGKK